LDFGLGVALETGHHFLQEVDGRFLASGLVNTHADSVDAVVAQPRLNVSLTVPESIWMQGAVSLEHAVGLRMLVCVVLLVRASGLDAAQVVLVHSCPQARLSADHCQCLRRVLDVKDVCRGWYVGACLVVVTELCKLVERNENAQLSPTLEVIVVPTLEPIHKI